MSSIADTAANVAASITTNVVSRVWDQGIGQANYLINFADNHQYLTSKMIELGCKRDYVKRRIQVDEANEMTRTPVVEGWLRRVEAIEFEVDLILQEGAEQLQQRCIGGCCLKNWWTCYRLGKKTSKKLALVLDLISNSDFGVVADKSPPAPVQFKQESQTVGMDALFDKVWKLLGEEDVKIVGIYGMGGVGKTTLLRRINNSFSDMNALYDVVIWVVVSREIKIAKIQRQISDRLGLAWSEDGDEAARAQRIFNVLRMKKCVVLLDDIWQQIELDDIGIPLPPICNSKVVFTTRSESVCASMGADKKVRVDVLPQDQALVLFQQKVGQEALNSHPEIPKMAEEVAKECDGLPLAIITLGRAMATKKTPQEWQHAIKTLQKSASEFSGMEDKVLATLKFSYDNLENDAARSLFLYFSLYPEDYDINTINIIGEWVEEFVDEYEDIDDAYGMAFHIIGLLKSACLLESGDYLKKKTVRMHDLIRDLALWIGRECGKKKNKYLVQAGVGLTQAPNLESWHDAQRISLMENHISELPKPPNCPFLLSLKLSGNPLSNIAPDFFNYMPNLRVLDLTVTKIAFIPKSISGLVELRCLWLGGTDIRTLPDELANLKKLRFLSLNFAPYLKNIPGEVISKFSRLQNLGIFEVGLEGDGNICLPGVEELECLEHLKWLSITVQDSNTLKSMCLSPRLSSCLCYICISNCQDLTQLELAPSLLLGNMKKMEALSILGCLKLEEVAFDCSNENICNMGLLSTLEILYFRHLPKLNIVWTGEKSTHLHFKNLIMVQLIDCDKLKDISWLVLAPLLSELLVQDCKNVEEILVNEDPGTVIGNHALFSRLQRLILTRLPKLKSISRIALTFSSLAWLEVVLCPSLKKLPFAPTRTSHPLLTIYCDKKWSDGLQWQGQTSFCFRAFSEDDGDGDCHWD